MEKISDSATTIYTVISGSFHRHLPQIVLLRQSLERRGIRVLSPRGNHSLNPFDEFVVLDSDPIDHPELLQSSVFAKIRNSSFLVVANFNGYLGNATILEIGYAIAIGIKIFTIEPILDPNIAPYCCLLATIFPGISIELTNANNMSRTEHVQRIL